MQTQVPSVETNRAIRNRIAVAVDNRSTDGGNSDDRCDEGEPFAVHQRHLVAEPSKQMFEMIPSGCCGVYETKSPG